MIAKKQPGIAKKQSKQLSVPDNMIQMFNITTSVSKIEWLKILVSGDSNAGKTALTGTSSRCLISDEVPVGMRNVFYMEFDPDGSATLQGMGVVVDKVTPNCYKNSTGQKTRIGIINILDWLSQTETLYDTIVIDPYDKLQDVIAREIISEEAGKQHRGGSVHPDDKLELSDYGALYTRCDNINNKLLSLNKNIIVTCKLNDKVDWKDIRKVKMEEKNRIITPMLDGKMAYIIGAEFSLHGYIYKDGSGINRKVKMNMDSYNFNSKSRYRLSSNEIDNPSIPGLMNELGILTDEWDLNWARDSMGWKATEHMGHAVVPKSD